MSTLEDFKNNYPYLSCIKSSDKEYIGIILNSDHSLTSIYDISCLKDSEEKRVFLELGDTWWWESNRRIPINIFLKNEMKVFKYMIKTFNSKDVELVFGPTINLSNIAEKRIKRKSIQLVRSSKSN
jgi:hypothetical protein